MEIGINDCYIADIKLYKEIVRRVLDDGLYDQLYRFFGDVLTSDYDIKLFMARKCYCLLKVFRPIFEFDEPEKYKNKFDNVLNDRSLFFNAGKISKTSKILLVDDTMKFGRTVANSIDEINSVFEIPKENISVCVFAILETYLKHAKDEDFACFIKGSENEKSRFLYKSLPGDNKFPEKTAGISVFGRVYFYSERYMNKLTSRFIEVIHAVGESYSGYSPYFFMPLKDMDNADGCKASPIPLAEKVKNNLKNYEIKNITIHEQKANGVYAFLVRKSNGDIAQDGCLYSGIRLIIHEKLKRATIIPLAIIPDLKIEEAYLEFKKITGYEVVPDKRLPENSDERATIKYNSIIYAYGYIMAQKFICGVLSCADNTLFETNVSPLENGHYQNSDFQCSTTENTLKLDIHKEYDFKAVFNNNIGLDEKISVESDLKAIDGQFEETAKELANDSSHNVFDFLSLFFYKLVKSDKPSFAKTGRYPINVLYKKVLAIFGDKINADAFFAALVKTTELGISGTRIFSRDNWSYSFIQEGEAGGDNRTYIPVSGLHTSLEVLDNVLSKRCHDESSEADFNRHLCDIKLCYMKYVKENINADEIDHISSFRIEHLFNSANKDEHNHSRTVLVDVETDSRLKYFINFTRFYLGYSPPNLESFKNSLLERKSLETNEYERKNIDLVLKYIPGN